MSDDGLNSIRDLIQEDVGQRGLRNDPAANLISACADDFAGACRGLADNPEAALAIVTGFFIPHATPPAGETDGPLGALYLARALVPLGIKVALVTDAFCSRALQVGLSASGLDKNVPLLTLPAPDRPWQTFLEKGWLTFVERTFGMTHLLAIERVGPSHTLASLQARHGMQGSIDGTYLEFFSEVPPECQDRCYSMRGADITAHMSPAHLLFETVNQHAPNVVTIGIGDGGNEIGMGKIPWSIIRRNIPRGGLVACRVPADHLIVCGVSNWGAYGLAAGVRRLRGAPPDGDLFEPDRELALLRLMVEQGPLVDGVTGQQTATVDGLSWERYVEPLRRIAAIGE